MKYSKLVELQKHLSETIILIKEVIVHREECGLSVNKLYGYLYKITEIRDDLKKESQYIIDRFMETNNFKD